ncbi:MAG: DUF4834 family protein [Paludibacteraceae bacterium]|nr:DUF4834 family protein [Paludibacteraceae bacterium]
MHLIFSILILIVFIGVLSLLFVLGFVRSLFNFGRKSKKGNQPKEDNSVFSHSSKKKKKIFDKNDGEYVDFEEIDEEKK